MARPKSMAAEATFPGRQGVPVHHSEAGAGEPTLVCCNGFAVSTAFWKYLVGYFSRSNRVITWDYRGHGNSGAPGKLKSGDFSINALVEDLHQVLEKRKVKKAVLVGHSMGCQIILEYWNRHRDRVSALVLVCGAYGNPLSTFMGLPWQVNLPLFHYFRILGTRAPMLMSGLPWLCRRPGLVYTAGRLASILPPTARYEDMRRYFEHLATVDVRTFWTLMGEMQAHSAESFLGEIDVPTLVVAGESDQFSPLQLSLDMHEKISQSELLVLPQATHTGLIEQPELLNLRMEKFLRERVRPASRSRKPSARKKAAPAKKPSVAKKPMVTKRKTVAKKSSPGRSTPKETVSSPPAQSRKKRSKSTRTATGIDGK